MGQERRLRPGADDIPASGVPGLRYRRLQAPADYGRMNEIANAARIAHNDTFYTTEEQFQRFYERIERCDLTRDLFLVELDGRLVAYVRVGWHDEQDVRVYEPILFLDPAGATEPIFDELFDLAERRVAEVADGHPPGPKVARTTAADAALEAVITARGYEPVRWFYVMVRPTLDDLPDAPLPDRPRDPRRAARGHGGDLRGRGRGDARPLGVHRARSARARRLLPRPGPVGHEPVAGCMGRHAGGRHGPELHPPGAERPHGPAARLGREHQRPASVAASRAGTRPDRGQLPAAAGARDDRGRPGRRHPEPHGAVGVYERCGFVVVNKGTELSRTLAGGAPGGTGDAPA